MEDVNRHLNEMNNSMQRVPRFVKITEADAAGRGNISSAWDFVPVFNAQEPGRTWVHLEHALIARL